MPLKDLDLVTVRVLNEEEARDHFTVRSEVDQLAWIETCLGQTGVFGIHVVDAEGDVAVSVAQIVGLVSLLKVRPKARYFSNN